MPILPKNLDEIDFDLPEYKLYTETSEFKPFLQYDNTNKLIKIFFFYLGELNIGELNDW